MQSPTVFVIVTYNAMKWIERCIYSVYDNNCRDIIVIDNASSDGTADFIKNTFPDVHLICQDQNLGFGAANNIGLRIALERRYKYILLLNQDAWIQSDTVQKLVRASLDNPEFGIISPMHLNGQGNLIDHLLYQNIIRHPCGRTLFSDLKNKDSYNRIYELTYVNAACWLLTQTCLLTVGLFDPIFRHYGEDNNYCHRTEYHHLKIGLITDAVVYHDREDRYGKMPSWQNNNELELKLSLANILNPDFNLAVKKERRKVLRAVTKSLLQGDLKRTWGHFYKMYLIRKVLPELKQSYIRNKNVFNQTLLSL